MVFIAENIGQNRNAAVVFLNQPHGNTGNRFFHRHAGCHQRHGCTANRCHRRRTVRFHNFRNDTDGIGKSILVFRQHRMNGAPCQLAVTDFAASRAAHSAAFANRKRRKIIVQHKVFFILVHQTVDNLSVFAGTQRRNYHCLGFAAREQRRTMGTWQDIDFALYRTNGFGVTAVNTVTGSQNLFADNFVHQLFNRIADITHFQFIFRINGCLDFLGSLADQLASLQFVGFFESFFIFADKLFFNTGVQSVKLRRKRGSFPSRLTGFSL